MAEKAEKNHDEQEGASGLMHDLGCAVFALVPIIGITLLITL